MSFLFSKLKDSQLDEAFEIFGRVGRALENEGRKQRISKTSLDDYRIWQAERSNYVITQANQIVGIATIRLETLVDWPSWHYLGAVPMLRGLATDPRFRGRGVGTFAIENAISISERPEGLFLDCVSDTLPRYYERFGFSTIDRQVRSYSGDDEYDITLMRFLHDANTTRRIDD